MPNLRDVGGATVRGGGTVARGTLFRSTQLSGLADADRGTVEGLGLDVVVDLRTAAEVERAPDVPVAPKYLWLDVLRDHRLAAVIGVEDVFADPQRFRSVLQDGTARLMMLEAYQAMVDLPSARRSYGRWLCDLAEADGPVLVHCTNGKDRTGWAVALALLAVGVEVADIFTDYLMTNDQLIPALADLFAAAEAQGVDPQLLLPVMGVREEYLAAALARVDEHGGLQTYVQELGVTTDTLGRLRERLTR